MAAPDYGVHFLRTEPHPWGSKIKLREAYIGHLNWQQPDRTVAQTLVYEDGTAYSAFLIMTDSQVGQLLWAFPRKVANEIRAELYRARESRALEMPVSAYVMGTLDQSLRSLYDEGAFQGVLPIAVERVHILQPFWLRGKLELLLHWQQVARLILDGKFVEARRMSSPAKSRDSITETDAVRLVIGDMLEAASLAITDVGEVSRGFPLRMKGGQTRLIIDTADIENEADAALSLFCAAFVFSLRSLHEVMPERADSLHELSLQYLDSRQVVERVQSETSAILAILNQEEDGDGLLVSAERVLKQWVGRNLPRYEVRMFGKGTGAVSPIAARIIRPYIVALASGWRELVRGFRVIPDKHSFPVTCDDRDNMKEDGCETNDAAINLTDFDFLYLGIARQEVEAGDISRIVSNLRRLLDKNAAIRFCERVDVSFSGYDDDPRELYEIEEVRDFIYRLDAEFPYWLYFLSKRGAGLLCIIYCFLPPYLTKEAKAETWPPLIREYLLKRGFPSMNHICDQVGCSEREVERLTDRVFEYIRNGPDRGERDE